MKLKKYYHYFFGLICGIIIGIFPIVELFTNRFGYLNDSILYIPRRIVYVIIDCWFCDTAIIMVLLLSILQWSVSGLIIIFLIKKIINLSRKK